MMKGGIAGLMKQAQQMQEKMKVAQEQLSALEVTGQAAGGLVKVTISGKYELKRVQIDPGAMDAREMLEDVIVTARDAAGEVVASDPTLAGHVALARAVAALVDDEQADFLEKS